MTAARRDDDLDDLRAALRADAAAIAETLMGPPNKALSSPWQLRWGSKGGLALEVRGPKMGLWIARDDGDAGGDMLALIQRALTCSFAAALTWARSWTGIGRPANERAGPRPVWTAPANDADAAAEVNAERTKSIGRAQAIAAGAVAIAGSTGERYLRQVRGIPAPAGGWPAAIMWHPGHRAIVAVATADEGAIQAVQRIHLDGMGEKVSAAEMEQRRLRAVKQTNGHLDGAAVRLPGNLAGPLLLAEGPETGLAAYTATGHETWIALGGLGNLKPPRGRQVVVVADDDPPAHDAKRGSATKALNKALSIWRQRGVDVVVARPWPARRHDTSDMADVILADGVAAVRRRITAALNPGSGPPPRVSAADARRTVGEAVGAFFGRVDDLSAAIEDWAHPPTDQFTHAVRVDVGVGKSHEARCHAANVLAAMRARGDMRTVVIAVPTHALGDEQAAAFMGLPVAQRAGLTAAIWRGRSAADPDEQARDEVGRPLTMCRDLERVRDAQSIGLAVQTACCKGKAKLPGGKKETATCPLFAGCAYQAQMGRKADLWFVAHDLLFHQKPKAIGDVAAVVVDEGAWRKGLLGAEGRHQALSFDSFDEDCTVRYPSGTIDHDGTARLTYLRGEFLEVLRRLPDGSLHRDAVRGSILTIESAAEAVRLEWDRKVEPLHPGQTRVERRNALEAAEGNRTIGRMAMAWGALRTLLASDRAEGSGWLAIATEQAPGGPVRGLRLKARAEIAIGWRAPTLLLDALMPIALVRPFWPDVVLVADVRAEMPHQHVRQVVDRAYAKSMLEQMVDDDGKPVDSSEARRRTNRLHDLRDFLVRESRRHRPGRVLVVAQQAVEEALRDLGSLPPNVELAHHNAVAGRDEWRDVSALIVVGRTQPSPAGVERIAEALTGDAVAFPVGWYDRADAAREMTDGTWLPAEADRHPDPVVEAIRWQIAEGELLQIIGRGRGVNRTEADPLEVLVLTDLPLPIPLAGTLEAVELEPTVADRMMGSGGMVLENPTDAAAVYPFLWGNREAAKKALQRGKLGTFPYKDSLLGECPQLRRIDYKPVGQGRSQATAGYDPVLCPDPEAFLRERLGELAWCRVGDEEASDTPTSAVSKRRSKAGKVGVSGTVPDIPPLAAVPLPSPPASAEEESTAMPTTISLPQDHVAPPDVLDEQELLSPATFYRPGFVLEPHADFPRFDALPIGGSWRIKRRDLPAITVQALTPAYRVITAERPAWDDAVRPWLRVQGPDRLVEPVGIMPRRRPAGRAFQPDTRVARVPAREAAGTRSWP